MKDAGHTKRGVRKWGLRALQAALGLSLGMLIAEGVFHVRADGAFPHVNFYLEDAELGVRLQPGASMRFQLGANPLSKISVGQDGYRRSSSLEGEAGGIVVVGDSQVFGLGVDDDQTFAAQLQKLSGRAVKNGGVPTYGPQEYRRVAAELIAAKQPETLVYTINFLNDSFELRRSNRERHTVWDGWAVRTETAPDEYFRFPGRQWLFSRSHAVYAFRRWWHGRQGQGVEAAALALPSEGTWTDLIDAGQRVGDELKDQLVDRQQHRAALVRAAKAVSAQEREIAEAEAAFRRVGNRRGPRERRLQDIADAKPGDIVRDSYAEASRSVEVTAKMIREAAASLRRIQARKPGYIRRARDRVEEQTARGVELRREHERMQALDEPEVGVPSVFLEHLRELDTFTRENHVKLVVAVLPIDVQVSPDEWKKYGVVDPPDMEPTMILIEQIMEDCRRLGIRAIDLSAPLRQATPGAFLDGDIHMTPKGHHAVARALANFMKLDPSSEL